MLITPYNLSTEQALSIWAHIWFTVDLLSHYQSNPGYVYWQPSRESYVTFML